MKKIFIGFFVTFYAAFTCNIPAFAADRTWTGNAFSVNWSNANNWDTVPSAGDSLIFTGSNQLATNWNNFADNTQFNGITFNSAASGFLLRGNDINLGGNITNSSSASQSIAMDLALL